MSYPPRPNKSPDVTHYSDKVANLIEAGVWGRAYANTLRIGQRGTLCTLPMGSVQNVRKLFLYLNADAVVFINDQPLRMHVTKHGFWELLADTPVHSLAVRADVAPAIGKYVVFGD